MQANFSKFSLKFYIVHVFFWCEHIRLIFHFKSPVSGFHVNLIILTLCRRLIKSQNVTQTLVWPNKQLPLCFFVWIVINFFDLNNHVYTTFNKLKGRIVECFIIRFIIKLKSQASVCVPSFLINLLVACLLFLGMFWWGITKVAIVCCVLSLNFTFIFPPPHALH